jgi:hypothetical protein
MELPDALDWVIGVGYVIGIQMITPGLNDIRGWEPFWRIGEYLNWK